MTPDPDTTCRWCHLEIWYVPLNTTGNTAAIWNGGPDAGGFYCKKSPAAIAHNPTVRGRTEHRPLLPDVRNQDWVRAWLEGRTYRSSFAIAA